MLYRKASSISPSFAYTVEWYRSCIQHCLYLEALASSYALSGLFWVVTDICMHIHVSDAVLQIHQGVQNAVTDLESPSSDCALVSCSFKQMSPPPYSCTLLQKQIF